MAPGRFRIGSLLKSYLFHPANAPLSLESPVWTTLAINTLTAGTADFGGRNWNNFSARFYRVRLP